LEGLDWEIGVRFGGFSQKKEGYWIFGRLGKFLLNFLELGKVLRQIIGWREIGLLRGLVRLQLLAHLKKRGIFPKGIGSKPWKFS